MRSKLFHITGCCLMASSLALSNAAQAKTRTREDQKLQQILQEMQSMQHEMNALNTEVNTLKRENRSLKHAHSHSMAHSGNLPPFQPPIFNGLHKPATKVVAASSIPTSQSELTPYARMHRAVNPAPPVRETAAPPGTPVPAALEASRFTQGVTVTTSPLLGLRSSFDASDLVVNLTTMNEDLRLLEQRHLLTTQLRAAGVPPLWDQRSVLELSGALEAQGIINQPFKGQSNNTIDLTRGEFDTLAYISPGITGLMSFTYDNSPLPPNIQGSGQRFANSRLFLRRGFVTVGDLGVTPFYFSVGQMFAPFGRYNTQMLSNPMTATIGQTLNRIALLGFYNDGLYAEGYVFRGDAAVGPSNNINNGGANIGYQYNGNDWGFGLGAGYIRDLADSLGIQKTGAASNMFQGFGFNSATESLHDLVPGADLHGAIHVAKVTLIGEYVGATSSFNANDLSFESGRNRHRFFPFFNHPFNPFIHHNGRHHFGFPRELHGARPQAVHLEGDYSFKIVNRFPAVFSLAFDRSWQALGLNVPEKSYTADLNMSFFKNTIETLEYRHDINYSTNDFSSGNNNGNGFTFPPIPVRSVGGTQNTVIAQIGAYF